jgi:xanthine dehydrogenase YagS FAD-binding subunit
MQNFIYKRITTVDQATSAFASPAGSLSADQTRFLAGGTTLIDLMKLEVEKPKAVIDINALPYKEVKKNEASALQIGALVKNSELAHNPIVQKEYPVLSQALLAGASAQLRNKATTSGNLLQRTRCVYFRDPSKPCNKREPKSGCSAIDGFNRNLAILGTSSSCIASNPSDMNVAMTALEAKINIVSKKGSRSVDINDFYLLPGSTPEKETLLETGDFITGVTVGALPAGTKSLYLKLRDRASYEFALSSAAIVATMKDGRFERIRMAMGGIGAKPWRSLSAEKILEGGPASEERFRAAAEEFVKGAKAQSQNGFKIELAKRCLVHALNQVAKA